MTLDVASLSVTIDKTPILTDISLTAGPGITALVGPSGSGKTTLLRTIAGFARPSAGSISIDGTVVASTSVHVPTHRRTIGYVAQEGLLFPHLSVASNIGFGLPRRERTAARIAELLALVDLPSDFASRRPDQLSGGQQQRVAVARALAPQPTLVLLDEPFASLDPELREATGTAVADVLRTAGATAILVTHDYAESARLADQVVELRDGRRRT